MHVFKIKKLICYTLFPLQFFLIAIASGDVALQTCMDMQGKEPPDKVLECYNQVAQQQQVEKREEKKHSKLFLSRHNRGLAYEWAPVDTPFMVYKQNYLLFYSYSSHPNYDPTTPDISPHIPIYSYKLDNKDVKFQISFKSHLLGTGRRTLWAGYTQLSFWQFYDHHHSTPFRETNYEPELIYSYRPKNQLLADKLYSRFLNVGLAHQSDGQSLPGSRGWNRLYFQVGLERNLGNDATLELLPRMWVKLPHGTEDITSYLGYGDIEMRYRYGQGVYSAIVKAHSLQLDIAFPLPKLHGVQILDTNLHLQYFNGYGESLIDYNQKHHTLGIGISLPYE